MKLDTLYSERLILRQFSKEDLEDYTAIMTNPQVTCFLGTGKEKTPEDVRQVLIHFQNCLDKNGFGVWAVVLKESGKLIGHCGFLPLETGRMSSFSMLLTLPHGGRKSLRKLLVSV